MKNLYVSSLVIFIAVSGCKDSCSDSRISGDYYVTDSSLSFMPESLQFVFLGNDGAVTFESVSHKIIDTTFNLGVYCTDFWGSNWEMGRTKMYQDKYLCPGLNLTIEYILKPEIHPYTESGSYSEKMMDVMEIILNRNNDIYLQKSFRLITDTRSLPDTTEYITDLLYFDILPFGAEIYTNIHADTSCYSQSSSIPCQIVFKKGKGIVAMRFPEGEYLYLAE